MGILYITGFNDFAAPQSTGLLQNPARLLVEHIERTPSLKAHVARLAGATEVITTLRNVPKGTDFTSLREVSKKTIERVLSAMTPSDAILSFGQGRFTQRGPVIESRFVNTLNFGQVGSGLIDLNQLPTHTQGQEEKLRSLVESLQRTHPEVKLGTDAGTFICNLWGYLNDAAAPGRSLFVHLPGSATREVADTLWTANEAVFKAGGVQTRDEMSCPSVENNFAFLLDLVREWKPFEPPST